MGSRRNPIDIRQGRGPTPDSPSAGGRTIPFLEPAARFAQRAAPTAEDLRTTALRRLAPQLPPSFG
ncbi:MAG: hypothetical protein FJ280_09995 [Planctomycetes bacterium]|nr:hypothetical protein [Planctomycetota bacterium]